MSLYRHLRWTASVSLTTLSLYQYVPPNASLTQELALALRTTRLLFRNCLTAKNQKRMTVTTRSGKPSNNESSKTTHRVWFAWKTLLKSNRKYCILAATKFSCSTTIAPRTFKEACQITSTARSVIDVLSVPPFLILARKFFAEVRNLPKTYDASACKRITSVCDDRIFDAPSSQPNGKIRKCGQTAIKNVNNAIWEERDLPTSDIPKHLRT